MSRRIVFRQGGHVCGCLYFMLALLLSRCVVFRQLTCQDGSSLGRWSCTHVCGCLYFMLALMLSRCVVFRQLTCQDVSSLGRGSCIWLSVLYVSPIVVKMCRLSATNLSRWIVFREGVMYVVVCALCWP